MAVEFTDTALRRVRSLLAEKPEGWFRVAIRGGGCSGLSYFLDVVEAPGEKDKKFEHVVDGAPVRVCIDHKSYLFLVGVRIDYTTDLVKQGFTFENPNAKRSCSCGESFTL
jgi:iron-sulfur cluster assembly protein